MPPLVWRARHERLAHILGVRDAPRDVLEANMATALDAKSSSNTEVQKLRFTNSDLVDVGSLEKGQFGVVEVVQCRLDERVYARKTIQKLTADRFREHCFVQHERDLLLRATVTQTPWAPHLICAYATSDALNLLMDYAEGGTLWDALESSPDSRLLEDDLRWWLPQAVSAISWCHSQGFAHRDIKPQNLVIDQRARLKLIDFGCAAPLLPPHSATGVRSVAKPYCLVPCGTCDYISPEILQMHEDALFAAELGDDIQIGMEDEGYGFQTDWWSLGAVMYELALGVAPFFANDIQTTYALIVEHERSEVEFDSSIPLSRDFKSLVKRFLSCADDRLGRGGIAEIQGHPWLQSTDWNNLHLLPASDTLFLPNFAYAPIKATHQEPSLEEASSPFDFSHLFKSSPGLSSRDRTSTPAKSPRISTPKYTDRFAGFSWGPARDAFARLPSPRISGHPDPPTPSHNFFNPRLGSISHSRSGSLFSNHRPSLKPHATDPLPISQHPFATPIRERPHLIHLHTTIPRANINGNSSRRKRMVSDREALRQMLVCVGASARKKVIQSGRKPRAASRGPSIGAGGPNPTSNRPRIPSLLVNVKPLHQHHTSLSADEESAPPSPSPRPGSSLSRRSGSASPYPYVRSGSSAAMASMLMPTDNTGPLKSSVLSLPPPPTARPRSTAPRRRTVSWYDDGPRKEEPSVVSLPPQTHSDESDVTKSQYVVLPPSKKTSRPRSARSAAAANESATLRKLESDLESLFRELDGIEERVLGLKANVEVSPVL